MSTVWPAAVTYVGAQTLTNGTAKVLCTLTVPKDGIICATGQTGVAPDPLALDGTILIGGFLIDIRLNGLQVAGQTSYIYSPTAGEAGWVLGGTPTAGYLTVSAGDVLTLEGLVIWQGSATNPWKTVNGPANPTNISSQFGQLSYHYIG